MSSTEARFQVQRDKIRKRLLKYTKKAFQMLPQLDKPRILDIGCGSGIPTIELARLSQGDVTGIDIDQPALDEFTRRIIEAGLDKRAQAVNCSMFGIDFADERFDIIWSEGSIYAIGFQRGLQEWERFLRPGGYMVIHDEQGNVNEKTEQVSRCGYELIGSFMLDEDIWWAEYFAPLEKLISETEARYTDEAKVLQGLQQALWEIEVFKKDPKRNSSVYFIMKKE